MKKIPNFNALKLKFKFVFIVLEASKEGLKEVDNATEGGDNEAEQDQPPIDEISKEFAEAKEQIGKTQSAIQDVMNDIQTMPE